MVKGIILNCFTNSPLAFVQLYKELSMTVDQKKLLRKLFQSFLDAVVELLQSEHAVCFSCFANVNYVLCLLLLVIYMDATEIYL